MSIYHPIYNFFSSYARHIENFAKITKTSQFFIKGSQKRFEFFIKRSKSTFQTFKPLDTALHLSRQKENRMS